MRQPSRRNRRRVNMTLPEVLLEFVPMGAYVKVSAVDPISGAEVSIVGDPAAGEGALRDIAIRKLEFVLAKHTHHGSPHRSRGGKSGPARTHNAFSRQLGRYLNQDE